MPATEFKMPPEMRTAEGTLRRVGFELEFAGLELAAAAEAVRELFGGKVVEEDRFRFRVVATTVGDFTVEADARLLRNRRYLEHLRRLGVPVDEADVQKPIDALVGWLAELVVPFEVTLPPLPLPDLALVEELRMSLAAREARGTGAGLRYALGLHLNPEAPSLTVESILRHLRAFLTLYDWLLETSDIDLSRSLAPFVDELPEDYRRLVLDPAYSPSIDRLAADYTAHNPTRNRALDLLPLLAHVLGPEALPELGDEELIQPRPTYHYRLPDCRIDEPDWTVAAEWNRWVEVERLAAKMRRAAEA